MSARGVVSGLESGILTIQGLNAVMVGELLELEPHGRAVVLGLERDRVVAGLLDAGPRLHSTVHGTGQVPTTPTGAAVLGRILDPLGRPLDQSDPPPPSLFRPIHPRPLPFLRPNGSIIPLWTGIRCLDLFQPLVIGELRLLVGEPRTGKTTLAVDVMMNHARHQNPCIFVAVGWEFGALARVSETLRTHGAMDNIVVVATRASGPPALGLLAPMAGMAIAEAFAESGQQALLIVDELTGFAAAARALSVGQRHPLDAHGQALDLPQRLWRLLERTGKRRTPQGLGSITTLALLRASPGDPMDSVYRELETEGQSISVMDRARAAAGSFPALTRPQFRSKLGPPALPRDLRRQAGLINLHLAVAEELRGRSSNLTADLDDSSRSCLNCAERIEAMLQQPAHTFTSPDELLRLATSVW